MLRFTSTPIFKHKVSQKMGLICNPCKLWLLKAEADALKEYISYITQMLFIYIYLFGLQLMVMKCGFYGKYLEALSL